MENTALVVSVVGILIMLILINFTEIETSSVSSVYTKMPNEKARIAGEITDISYFKNNFTILDIRDDTGAIKVICNCPNIQRGNAEITGKITEYKGEKEIQADKIVLKSP